MNYMEVAKQYGEIEYEGKAYALTEQAVLSNRVFPGWWGDAKAGESYTAEYQAHAMDCDGRKYLVRWQFETVKGEEPEDESYYPFDDDQVTQLINL